MGPCRAGGWRQQGQIHSERVVAGRRPEQPRISTDSGPEGVASVPTVERDQALSTTLSNSVAERLGGDGAVQERVQEVQRPGDQAASKRKCRKGSSSGGRAKKLKTPAIVNDSGE